jgi:hypothetical protein
MLVLLTATCAVVTASSLIISAIQHYDSSKATSSTITAGFAAACANAVVFLVFGLDGVLKLRRTIRRDRRAYYEIVDMLRELKSFINKKMHGSRLERVEFLIRLSRLDIGSGISFTRMILGDRILSPRLRPRKMSNTVKSADFEEKATGEDTIR